MTFIKLKAFFKPTRFLTGLLIIISGMFLISVVMSEETPTYTAADMPKLMAATWDEDVMSGGADPAAFQALLERGQLVIINEHTKKTKWLVTGGILVNARAETLFKVITDMEHYSQFMPMTENAQTTPLGPNIVDLKLTLKLKIVQGIPAIPMTYSVIHYHRPPLRSDWTAHTGRFDRNDGFYQFVPIGVGDRTMAFYTLYSLPRIPIAANLFAKDPTLELVMNMSTAAMVTRALKNRAEEVEKRTPFAPGKGVKGSVIDALSKDPKTVNLLLARGGLILVEDGPPMYATTAVAINASPDVVYRFITKFEDYRCYLTDTLESKVIERSETAAKAEYRLAIDYALLKVPLKYQLAYKLKAPELIQWKCVSGDIPSQSGNWTLLPLDEGKRTLGLFRLTEDLKTLPGFAGAGLRSSIQSNPYIEPAILGSLTLINARGTRDFIQMRPQDRQAKLDKCAAARQPNAATGSENQH